MGRGCKIMGTEQQEQQTVESIVRKGKKGTEIVKYYKRVIRLEKCLKPATEG